MRNALLLVFASLLMLAFAGTAEATCISCNSPCEDIYGPNYECNDDGMGYYGDCWNREPCRGCMGWFDQWCTWYGKNEVEPQAPAPLLGVQRVTQVVVRHDPTPVTNSAEYQVAVAR